MKIFLAGASGAIGRRLTPLLLAARHNVTGMTRHPETARALEADGIVAVTVDVFDASALERAVVNVEPDVIIHQLTDLPRALDNEAQLAAAYPRNARIRVEGTRNLIAAAQAAAALHVDAAARATSLAVTRGIGVYNIAEADSNVSIAKARAELGFDPAFRLPA